MPDEKKDLKTLDSEKREVANKIVDLKDSKEPIKTRLQKFEELKAEHDRINTDIANVKASLAEEVQNDRRRQTRSPERTESVAELKNWMRTGNYGGARNSEIDLDIKGAQTIGDSSKGGVLVDDSMTNRLMFGLSYAGDMRRVCQKMNTAGGEPMDVPLLDGATQKGAYIDEVAKAAVEDVTFGSTTLSAYKATSKAAEVSRETLEDINFDPEQWIPAQLLRRLARFENQELTKGTIAAAKIRGTLETAAFSNVTATVNGLTYSNILALIHSVNQAYRENNEGFEAGVSNQGYNMNGRTSFILNDQTLRALRSIVDGDGRPLWQPGLVQGAPDMLLGYPLMINDEMPDIGANAKSILFGSFDYYCVRNVSSIRLRRGDEVHYLEDKVGFVAFHRLDGRPVGKQDNNGLCEAYKYLVHAAA